MKHQQRLALLFIVIAALMIASYRLGVALYCGSPPYFDGCWTISHPFIGTFVLAVSMAAFAGILLILDAEDD